MSSRYHSRNEIAEFEQTPQSACAKCWKFMWKTITFLISHVALITVVVAYCAAGAFTFEALEVEHEKTIKRSIKGIRQNVTDHLWQLVVKSEVLNETRFINNVSLLIQNFEGALVKAMTKDGWDGEEDESIVQWTRTGSLFYSIVVITTIGYGHLCPKTPLGKVVTIFYAILGIPLMLLCLSNIGDIMATSFRFLYWRVCCYVCTKPKKPKRTRSMRSSGRCSERFSRSHNASFRRSLRVSTRSAESYHGYTTHSDTDLRYHDYNRRGTSLPKFRPSQTSRYSETYEKRGRSAPRGGSLDRKKNQAVNNAFKLHALDNSSILCNKYVIKDELDTKNVPGVNQRQSDYLRPPSPHENYEEKHEEHRRKKKSPCRMNPSPKMMTPLGYGHKSKYLDDPDSDEEFYYDDFYYDVEKDRTRPVPIGLCVFLVMSYIVGGAFLFDYWEQWGVLNAAYFCFITLTTIGFGDLVPAKGVVQDTNETLTTATVSIALCSLYLLFGISLLAMSFNLVQEEVINNVKSIAKTLGIIKSDDEEDSDDEEV